MTSVSVSAFQGPIPPPEMLERYEQVFPGCAKELVDMARSQSEHRQALESAVINGGVAAEKRGQILAAILGSFAIIGGIVLIAFDKDIQGLVAIVGALATLSGVFIWGRKRQERERLDKRKAE